MLRWKHWSVTSIPFKKLHDRPTNQPTEPPINGRTWGATGKLHFKKKINTRAAEYCSLPSFSWRCIWKKGRLKEIPTQIHPNLLLQILCKICNKICTYLFFPTRIRICRFWTKNKFVKIQKLVHANGTPSDSTELLDLPQILLFPAQICNAFSV